MKNLILLIGLMIPILVLSQEKRKAKGITLCFGVGPVYCYYGHNTWMITPGLLNDPSWDITTMSVPERKIMYPNIDLKNFQEKTYSLEPKKNNFSLPIYKFKYNPKILTAISKN